MQDVNIREVKDIKGTLYYFCNFPVSLKLFQTEKSFNRKDIIVLFLYKRIIIW